VPGDADERYFLILTVLRVAYAAAVLALGAIDVRCLHDISPRKTALEYGWIPDVDGELACMMAASPPVARWSSRCAAIRPGSAEILAQPAVIRMFP